MAGEMVSFHLDVAGDGRRLWPSSVDKYSFVNIAVFGSHVFDLRLRID